MYSSDDVFPTLSARSNSGQNQQSIYLCETANTGSNGFGIKRDDVMNTLDTSVSTAVAFAQNQRNEVPVMDVPGALSAQSVAGRPSYVALDFHQQDGRAKVELAVARGKKLYDKRQTIAKRDAARDIDRKMKERL